MRRSLPVGSSWVPQRKHNTGEALYLAWGSGHFVRKGGCWRAVLPEHRGQQVTVNNGSPCMLQRSPGCPPLFLG